MALACKKEDISLFNSEISGIYFQAGLNLGGGIGGRIPETYYDSTTFSFTSAPINTSDTILKVRMATMGKVRDYPRPVKVSADLAFSTAVASKHYEIDHNSAVIPPGASVAYLLVKFKRTPDMLDSTFVLMLKLEDNEHFKVYMEKQRNTNVYSGTAPQVYADRYKFIISEIYSQPWSWNQFSSYWGPWTATKYKYINAVLGWTPEDWINSNTSSSPVTTGAMNPAALTVRNKLQALADAGTPMLDEDGLGMQLGANYKVVY